MFEPTTYAARRQALRSLTNDGVILFLGHRMLPRNYRDNVYPFRQNSHVLYYCGISRPEIALLIGATPADDVLYGVPEDVDDIVWHGAHATLEDLAEDAGIGHVKPLGDLAKDLAASRSEGKALRFPPPFSAAGAEWLADVAGIAPKEAAAGASLELMRAIVAQRLKKSDDEIIEIENALTITREMHVTAMAVTRRGMHESDVAAAIQQVALKYDRQQAYNPIVTVRGEVLHNNTYKNRLENGQMMLNDSGAESGRYYASDITRAFPVSGKFTPIQRDVYQAVLDAQLAAIAAIKPGVPYRDVHLLACRVMTEGLIRLGLMKGKAEDAVAAGAHALFFPHGLGHMLGLDVHDLEDLGDLVGYREGEKRSTQFGLNYLRYAKPLDAGYVVTVEPGIYFIPALMDRWRAERRHEAFINYDEVAKHKDFGGIRIEDDVLCTANGARILGPAIPKTVSEVEAAMAG